PIRYGREVPLRRRHRRKALADRAGPDVAADHDALRGVDRVRGVPQLRDVAAGPRDATVDLLIGLPPPAIGLKGDLDGRDVEPRPRLDRALHGLGEIRWDVLQHRERNRPADEDG